MKKLFKGMLIGLLALCLVIPAYGASAVKLFDTSGVPKGLQIDSESGSVVTMTPAHWKIHKGLSYEVSYSVTTAATNGHRSAIYLKTPVEDKIHIVISASASTGANFSIHEGVTVDVNEGTNGVVIHNKNRRSSNTSGVFDNATIPVVNRVTTFTEAQIAVANFSSTTVLVDVPLVVGAGPKPSGGDTRGVQEWILAADTKYIFLITNTSASANAHYIGLAFYEVEED